MASSFTGEARYCPSPPCANVCWPVMRCPRKGIVWRVFGLRTGETYLVAAPLPVCPYCGKSLLTALELENRMLEGSVAEEGLLFDFACSLLPLFVYPI